MTQTDLYRSITGDHKTHHRTITAALATRPKAHRRVIELYTHGLTDREVAEATGRAHGACRGMLRRTMLATFKAIHKLPRYHVVGRTKATRAEEIQRAAHDAIERAARATREPGAAGHSFRDYLTPEESGRL